jgi:hypothetical protein
MRAARRLLCLTALIAVAIVPVRMAMANAPKHITDSLYTLVAAPSAAFVWFPHLPHVGEPVTMVSTANDFASPITTYGWDLTDFGAFGTFGPAITATFTTPASHLVRLQVTAADGLSSVAAETIDMSPAAPDVMNPFPIVQIVGTDYSYGTKITRLAIEAPTGALGVIVCRGRGCPTRSARRKVPSSRRGVAWIKFPRFDHLLRPGVVLKVRVSRGTEIGAYTSFTIRRRRLPARVDSCLAAAGVTPIVCPS